MDGFTDLLKPFEESCRTHRDEVAVVEEKGDSWQETGYGALYDRATDISRSLEEHQLGHGDRAAILLKNGSDWAASFFAVISRGAVCVPLNVDWERDDIANILKDCSCRLVLATEDLSSKLDGLECEVLDVNEIPSRDGSGSENSADISQAQLHEDACILYTSGTTGSPKGVVLTQKNLLANIESIEKLGVILPTDRVLSGLPLYHVYPLVISMLLPLLQGTTIIYMKELTPTGIKKAITGTEPTFFISVPQILTKTHDKIKRKFKAIPLPIRALINGLRKVCGFVRKATGFNLGRYVFGFVHKDFPSGFRGFAVGGAKFEKEVEQFLESLGFTMLQGYGMTEASPVISYNSFDEKRAGSVGKALPGVEIRIDPVEEGSKAGEVLVRGDNVMKGYYNKPDKTGETLKDGWLHTGDLGYLDEDGFLFLTGRKKEVIVLPSGKNIYPDRIEKHYQERLPIKEICVLDVKSPEDGSVRLHAIIVPERDKLGEYGAADLGPTVKRKIDEASRGLASNERVSTVTITFDPIPRTSLGKIKRFKVRELYERELSGEGGKRKKTEEDERFLADEDNAKVVEAVNAVSGAKEVFPGDLLESVGIDSLSRLELSDEVGSRFSKKFPDELFTNAFTVKELASGVKEHLEKAEEPYEKGASIEDRIDEKPSEATLRRIGLRPRAGAFLIGWFFLLPIRLIFALFFRLRVTGWENVPKEGPYIIYANHTSYFDPFLIACAVRPRPRLDLFFVGFRLFFEVPVIRRLVKVGRIIPVDFANEMLEALKSVYYVLDHKKGACLFPEGARSNDGSVKPFKKGFGMVADKADPVMVPVYIRGAYQSWPVGRKWPRPARLSVHIDEPVSVDQLRREGENKDIEQKSAAISEGAREHLKKFIERCDKDMGN